MTTQRSGGSVVSFIVIGAALVLLLVGGVYVVRHYGSDGAVERDTSEQTNDEGDSSLDENDTDTTAPGTDGDSSSDDASVNGDETAELPSGGVDVPSGTPEELPETGLGSALFSIVSLATLAGSSLHYIASRRQ